MENAQNLGLDVARRILDVAALLKQPFVPGLVAFGFLIALLLVTAVFGGLVWRRGGALKKARSIIEQAANAAEFRERIIEVDSAFAAMQRSRGAQRRISEAWTEYRETNLSDEDAVRNALRPAFFFNLDDMGLSLAGWRVVPGLFVSFGLALTFLGLISALDQIGSSVGTNDTGAMRDLMTIASAKFIMSLAGLVCSILFTIALRRGQWALDEAAHGLSLAVEKRSSFLSLEDLAREQLRAIVAQKEHMQKLNTELIAELGRPLREEIPAAISSAIARAIGPVVDRVGQVGTEGLSEMVRDLSTRFSADVGEALGAASARLSEAGERIGVLAARMDESSGRMGLGTEAAISGLTQALGDLRDGMARSVSETQAALAGGTEQMLAAMNTTLERIRENTASNAEAMGRVASEMRGSAEAFRAEVAAAAKEAGGVAVGQLSAAGEEITGALEEVAASIAEQAAKLTGKTRDELLAPLDDVRAAFERIGSEISAGSDRMERFAGKLDQSALAAERAAGQIEAAAQGFAGAAEPIKAAGAHMEHATGQLAAATSSTALSMREHSARVAGDTEKALQFARELLGGERGALNGSLSAINAALARFEAIAARHDEMDEKLGRAFQTFREQVERSVSEVQEHSDKVHQRYAEALDTLREVVDQAESFVPERRAG